MSETTTTCPECFHAQGRHDADCARPGRKPLTSTTWADFPNGVYPWRSVAGREIGWEAQADLGYELAAQTHLSVSQARRLVEFTVSGLPLVLTWETRLGNRYEGWRVERQTTTVIVESVTRPSGSHPHTYPGEARLRYCGFGHPIYLSEIVDVQVPKLDRTYVDVCIECDRPEDRHVPGCVADDVDPVDLADEAAGHFTPGAEY